jgi:hypothetical protein
MDRSQKRVNPGPGFEGRERQKSAAFAIIPCSRVPAYPLPNRRMDSLTALPRWGGGRGPCGP